MAVTLQCPRCMHQQKIDDDKAGKEVPCKICHHLIKAGGSAEKTKSKLSAPEKEPKEDGVKAGPPSVQPSKPTSTKKPKPDTDDVAEKRPSPRSRRDQEGSSSSMTMILLGGAAFVLLTFLCGGGGMGAYFLFGSRKPDEKVAQNDGLVPQDEDKPNPNNPDPGPRPGLPPEPNPVPPQPPLPERLDPNNPKHLERVLAELRGPVNQRGPAFRWLIQADSNHPRRSEVAQVLSGLLDEQMRKPFRNDFLFNAYFKWTTKESVPDLIRVVEAGPNNPSYRAYRNEAMKLLGRYKDVRGAEPIAKRLISAIERNHAVDALIEMGPISETAVMKYFNHPDLNTRASARRVLDTYNLGSDRPFTQSLADLTGADPNQRNGAVQFFAKSPVDEKRKSEVAKALNKCLDHPDCLRSRDLVTALETWATADNVPKLTQILDQSKFGNGPAIRILGKLRDPEGLKAVARSIANPFNHQEAKKALNDFGPRAEPAVIEAMDAAKDPRACIEYVRYLEEIGTKNVSLAALQQTVQRFPQDPFLRIMADKAQRTINARGK